MAASGKFGSFRNPISVDEKFINDKLLEWAKTDGRDRKREILFQIMQYVTAYKPPQAQEGVGKPSKKKKTKVTIRVLGE